MWRHVILSCKAAANGVGGDWHRDVLPWFIAGAASLCIWRGLEVTGAVVVEGLRNGRSMPIWRRRGCCLSMAACVPHESQQHTGSQALRLWEMYHMPYWKFAPGRPLDLRHQRYGPHPRLRGRTRILILRAVGLGSG